MYMEIMKMLPTFDRADATYYREIAAVALRCKRKEGRI